MPHVRTAYSVTAGPSPSQTLAPTTRPARWSSGATPVLYVCEHAAAALLEYRAHLQSSPTEDLQLLQLRLPETKVDELALAADLPWRERPYREQVQALGDAWLARGDSLVARVPSALIPHEYNLLINPQHPLFAQITFAPSEAFRLDQRLG